MPALSKGWLVGAVLAALWALLTLYRRLTRKRLATNSLKGKRVVITGASSGIGEALAYLYARLGASIVLAARRKDRLKDVATACRRIHAENARGGTGYAPEVVIVETDVTVPESCKALVDEAIEKLGGIDVLVLNAGLGASERFEKFPDLSRHHTLMDVNYWGCVTPTFYALDALRRSAGSIVVISSVAGKIATPLRTAYSGSKFALQGFFDALRFEMKEAGMNILLAFPGYVVTEIHNKQLAEKKQARNLSMFITAPQAADMIVEAQVNNDRELIMTTSAKVGIILRLIVPFWLSDWLVTRGSSSAFRDEE